MINLYDFDKTIYKKDSSIDFYLYCLKKNFKIIKLLPKQIKAFLMYKKKQITKTEMKEIFFSYLQYLDNVDALVTNFWQKNIRKIKKWYQKKKHRNDIIISASPEFLLKPLKKILKVKDIIASKVDKKTGKFLSVNCYGEEKVKRLHQLYKNIRVDSAYSDSLSDMPMLNLASKKYLVKKNRLIDITENNQYSQNKFIGFIQNNYIKLLSIFFILLIIGLCISIVINILITHNFYYLFPLLGTIFILLLLIFWKKKLVIKNNKYFYIFLLIAILVYISLLFLPYNEPYIDYETFYVSASGFALESAYNFKYIALFPHLWGYIMFLGIIFKLFGINYVVVVGTNIILNFIATFFLYRILNKISTKNIACIGTLLWLFNPLNIIWCMFAFGGTAFNAFLTIVIYITILFFKINSKKGKILYAIILGILLGIANLFRPVAIIFIIALIIEIIYEYFIKKNKAKFLIVICVFGILLSYIIINNLSTAYLKKEIGYEPATYVGFTLYCGSDITSGGSWSPTGSAILEDSIAQGDFDANQIQYNFQNLAIENYISNGFDNLKLLIQKFVTLTGDLGTYSWQSALDMLNIKLPSILSNLLLLICVASYYFLIIINLVFGYKSLRKKFNSSIFNILMLFLIGFTVASLLLEVSPRYYLPTLVPLTILGMISFSKSLKLTNDNN